MAKIVSVVLYATRPKGTAQWEMQNELVEDFTVHWLVEKLESLGKNHMEFILLNEMHVDTNGFSLLQLKQILEKGPVRLTLG